MTIFSRSTPSQGVHVQSMLELDAGRGPGASLGTPLAEVTFVVVDLETTGGTPAEAGITEIGAVAVRAGQVVGEFQTLVDPGQALPAFITALTGITSSMLAGAPRLRAALPTFFDFVRSQGPTAAWVAHNASYDMSFLRAGARLLEVPLPDLPVLDTVHLARQLLGRDEVRNHRLGTLAAHFGAHTTPDHRALHDARATVDVLHGLIERVGNRGVDTLEELRGYSARVPSEVRRKRSLAATLPSAPGVYVFRDAQGSALYVGTSGDIRRRVTTYFTAGERRARMALMVRLAESVTPVVCATDLEARVREVRLIASESPRFNRRSTRPHKLVWLKLTREHFPRLSIVATVREDGAHYVGPFRSRRRATEAMTALHSVFPLRQCTQSLPATPRQSAGCVLADLGSCGAPCTGAQTKSEYAGVAEAVRRAMREDPGDVVDALRARMRDLAGDERFEEAGEVRDRLTSLLKGLARLQRLAPLAASPQVVAARRHDLGGWELMCIRFGRLAGSSVAPRGADPMPYVEALLASAEHVPVPPSPLPAAIVEETEIIARWLETPGVRLVEVEGDWSWPVRGAAAYEELTAG
ncbi:MAG: DEDD exonuclease domain-containing protein [Dermatophilaceae bacterium]